MKYLVLLYGNDDSWAWEKWPKETLEAMNTSMNTLMEDLSKSGELVGGEGLASPARTKTVWFRNGTSVVTDGPYSEAKEVLAGYFLVDVESEDRALEIAKLIHAMDIDLPPSQYEMPIEVRPVEQEAGMEM